MREPLSDADIRRLDAYHPSAVAYITELITRGDTDMAQRLEEFFQDDTDESLLYQLGLLYRIPASSCPTKAVAQAQGLMKIAILDILKRMTQEQVNVVIPMEFGDAA